MIGGVDLAFPGAVLEGDLDAILRATRASWPRAFVESSDGSFAAPVEEALRRWWPIESEIFVYDSREAYESWTASGLTDENAEKMIAITVDAEYIAFVVSSERGATAAMARELMESVRYKRWLH